MMKPAVIALAAALAPYAHAQDFSTDVAPILRSRCIECHDAQKTKGDLRLDVREGLFGEDPDLWTVVPGEPEESELFRRVTLDASDDEHMPEKGPALAAAEIDTLRKWIAGGAKWPEGVTLERAPRTPEPLLPETSPAQRAARDAALAKIDDASARVTRFGEAVEILVRPEAQDLSLDRLRGLEPFLVTLDLHRTRTSDADLNGLAKFTELRSLNLAETEVTSGAMRAITALRKLETLNLVGTAIDDQALEQIAKQASLRRVFAWSTGISEARTEAFRIARPDVVLETGHAAMRMLARIRAQQVAAKTHPPSNDKCPISGKAADPQFAVVHEGERIAFCCKICLAKFRDNPAEFVKAKTAAKPPEPPAPHGPLIGKPFGKFDHVTWIDPQLDFTGTKLTLIRWWTDTCPFCADSMPALDRLAERHDGLTVLGMYHPKPPRAVHGDAIRAAAKRLAFEGPLAQDPGWLLLRSLQARGLPKRATSVSLLVDSTGTIRWVHPGPRIHEDPTGRHRVAAQSLAELEALVLHLLREED